jgi:hypothetical protein
MQFIFRNTDYVDAFFMHRSIPAPAAPTPSYAAASAAQVGTFCTPPPVPAIETLSIHDSTLNPLMQFDQTNDVHQSGEERGAQATSLRPIEIVSHDSVLETGLHSDPASAPADSHRPVAVDTDYLLALRLQEALNAEEAERRARSAYSEVPPHADVGGNDGHISTGLGYDDNVILQQEMILRQIREQNHQPRRATTSSSESQCSLM